MKIDKAHVELVSNTDYDEMLKVNELAIRNCYRSGDKIAYGSAEKIVRAIIKSGHEAMIEFASATFSVRTDRAIANQIVRHRLANYAQESTRYCNYSQDRFGASVHFIEPMGMDDRSFNEWFKACEEAEAHYFSLISKGCKAEQARSVLPLCTATTLYMNMNMREIRHFLSLRLDSHAQIDVQDIAKQMLKLIHDFYPVYVEDLWEKYGE